MKLSKYILVHSPDTIQAVKKRADKIGKSALLDISRSTPKTISIGVWDLGAWLGGLTNLIETMNRVQKSFVFFEVKATVPAGLISQPQRIIPWITDAIGRKLNLAEKRDIQNNLIANDFFELAEVVRKDLNIDYIVGITPSMVAGLDEEGAYWNHFSTCDKRTILASTFQLREFAKKSGHPFDAFLATILIAQVLVAKFYPKLGFHEDSGCIFDYNADRVSIMSKANDPRIEPSCMENISAPYRPAAHALVDFLCSFRKE